MNVTKEELLLKQRASFSFLALSLAWLFSFWPTLVSIFAEKDDHSLTLATYGIMFAAFYIVVKKREALKEAQYGPNQFGLIFVFLLGAVFIVGDVLRIIYIKQAIVILMIPALVLTSCGYFIARILAFPLLYLTLIVPLHEAKVEELFILIVSALILFVFYLINMRIEAGREQQKIPDWAFGDGRWLVPTAIGLSIIFSAPWLGENIRAFYPMKYRVITLRAPLGIEQWFGPDQVTEKGWKPNFPNASSVLQVQYYSREAEERRPIYLYTAYYYSDREFDDIFQSNNNMYDPLLWGVDVERHYAVELTDEKPFTLREMVLSPVSGSESDKIATHRLVWYWYYVAGVSTVDKSLAELLDKVRFISKHAQGAGVIVLSTTFRGTEGLEGARDYLRSYMENMQYSLDVLKRPEVTYEIETQPGI